MPLLYGEEEKAFMRLQNEIIRSTADLSILAWSLPSSQMGWPDSDDTHDSGRAAVGALSANNTEPYLCGLLAKSPTGFQDCGDYERLWEGGLREFAPSNLGIKTRSRVMPIRTNGSYYLVLLLWCESKGMALAVRLRQVSGSIYVRQDPWSLYLYKRSEVGWDPPMELCLWPELSSFWTFPSRGLASRAETMLELRSCVLRPRYSFSAPATAIPLDITLCDPCPTDRYDHEDALFCVSRESGAFSMINVRIAYTDIERMPRSLYFTVVAFGWSDTPNSSAEFAVVHGPGPKEDSETIAEQFSKLHTSPIAMLYVLEDMKKSRMFSRSISMELHEENLGIRVSVDPVSVEPNMVSRDLCIDLNISVTVSVISDGVSRVRARNW